MNSTNEIIMYDDPVLSMKIYELSPNYNEVSEGEWHYHKEVEVLVVIEGSMSLHINDEIHNLVEGDIFFIGPMEVHRDHIQNVRYIVLQFDLMKYIESSFMPFIYHFVSLRESLSKINYIFDENKEMKKEIVNLILAIYQESLQCDIGYDAAISIHLKQIILLIMRNDCIKKNIQLTSQEVLRLKPVLQYIEQNLTKEISVQFCCNLVNLNYHYFLKFFKKTMGMTFVRYIQYEKIKVAERLLLTEQLSIEEIARKAGFQNMGHFYKTFYKFHDCTPLVYKKRRI